VPIEEEQEHIKRYIFRRDCLLKRVIQGKI